MGLLDFLFSRARQDQLPGILPFSDAPALPAVPTPFNFGMLGQSQGFPASPSEIEAQKPALNFRTGIRPRPDVPFGPFPAIAPFGGLLDADMAQVGGMPGLANPAGRPGEVNIDSVSGAGGLPPSTNDPLAGEPEVSANGQPVERPPAPGAGLPDMPPLARAGLPPLGPPEDDEGDAGDQLPVRAQPAGPLAVAPAPAVVPPTATPAAGDFFKNLLSAKNAPLFFGLASGFAGAPSIGTGLRRASAASIAPAALIAKESQAIEDRNQTAKALLAKGVPRADVEAAVRNPDLMKALIGKYFETKPAQIVNGRVVREQPDGTLKTLGDFSDDNFVPTKVTDALGNESIVSTNKKTGEVFDSAGRKIGAADATGGAQVASGGLLAKGVDSYNPELVGDDYLAQFSPEVQSAIRSYIRGDTQPTGNPRLKGFETNVKKWARKYGDDVGVEVSDAKFSERRAYRGELGKTSANTAGGQAKAFNQGIAHAEALASKLEQLKNVDPVGIPAVANSLNWMRQAFSTKQTGIAKEAASIGQTLAGEVGKLFSGSAGGGVHERELTRQRFNTITSPLELAAALDATLETMEGGLTALEQRRDAILGQNNDVTLVPKATQEKIDRIRETVRRLRGEGGAGAPMNIKPIGVGQSVTINGVTIKKLSDQ